ncbi:MAG TPA: hypothetical protein VL358_15635 [Caulobacteraceae bacterium]|nr:hypothetical protein [Caulobacteraceae bacterium]
MATLAGCASRPHTPISVPVAVVEAGATRAAAEVLFEDGPPAVIAPRLASECTRRRMALIRNTPEQVVCKSRDPGAVELVGQPVSELWSFVLSAIDGSGTKVAAKRSFESATPTGHAVLSLAASDDQAGPVLYAFLDAVRDLKGLKGSVAPAPLILTN